MDFNVNDQIPHPTSPPIYTELMWIIIFTLCIVGMIWRHRGKKELNNSALMFIGATSMFWQEFFNNWGGYLLYSPDLHLFPWGSSWWTAPNKPIFLLFSYGPFFTLFYSVFIGLNLRAKKLFPSIPLFAVSVVVCAPLFWLWNYFVDGTSVKNGVWNYMAAWGPVQVIDGNKFEPLVWPMLPFALYAAAVAYCLTRQDENGHPTFLRLGRPERYAAGWPRETVRAVTSIIWWNAMYWFGFTMWINLVRQLFLPSSPHVP